MSQEEIPRELIFKDRKELLSPGVDEYADAHTSGPPALLQQLERDTAKLSSRIMLSDRSVGRLLKILASALVPQLAIDIGTYTGNSALSIAEGLSEGGRVITCEHDPQMAAAASKYFAQSPYRDRIELRVAPALDTIRAITEPIGLAFIDGDKGEYIDYYETILKRLAPRGVIVVDNTLMLGSVLMSEEEAKRLHPFFQRVRNAIAAFNRHVLADARTEKVLLTVSDGLTIITKRQAF